MFCVFDPTPPPPDSGAGAGPVAVPPHLLHAAQHADHRARRRRRGLEQLQALGQTAARRTAGAAPQVGEHWNGGVVALHLCGVHVWGLPWSAVNKTDEVAGVWSMVVRCI